MKGGVTKYHQQLYLFPRLWQLKKTTNGVKWGSFVEHIDLWKLNKRIELFLFLLPQTSETLINLEAFISTTTLNFNMEVFITLLDNNMEKICTMAMLLEEQSYSYSWPLLKILVL